jgi:hypothetical protein
MNSCGKYEDGPNFSLLTKKARLTREWDVKSIGNDILEQGEFGFTITFDKDGSLKYTYSGGTQSESYSGTWDFASDKENLVITADNDSEIYEIKRLTNKELWLDTDESSADGDLLKLEAN